MAVHLTVIRHGETEWNKIGKQQGHLDSPLTENGIRQAIAIRDSLHGNFDIIITSDLGRATQTANLIAVKNKLTIVSEPGLRERNLGILQGLTMEDFGRKYPEEYARFNSEDPDYVIPNGENARQRYERAIRAFESIVASYPGEKILVVTHGGILESLFRHTLGIAIGQKRAFSLINGSINRFSFDGTWKLESWGETGHLIGLNALDDF